MKMITNKINNRIDACFFYIDEIDKDLKEIIKKCFLEVVIGKQAVEDSMEDEFEEKFHIAINDDLNMPSAMSVVWDVIRYPKKSQDLAKLLLKFDEVLGLKIDEPISNETEIPEEILKLAEQRKIARENKNWELSDKIRDIIKEKGYIIKDSKEGMKIERA